MTSDPKKTLSKQLRWPLGVTWAGLFAERFMAALWPLGSVFLAGFAAFWFGLHRVLPVEAVWGGILLLSALAVWAVIYAVRRFSWPMRADAVARVDATLAGRPLATLADSQAIGRGDAASEAVWQAHLGRMADRAGAARPVAPDLRTSHKDPYALRYAALLAFVMALLFGAGWRAAALTDGLSGSTAPVVATGPSWEGWATPPAHTGKPTLYLNDLAAGPLVLPVGSAVSIRVYGEADLLGLTQSVTDKEIAFVDGSAELEIAQTGALEITGEGGRRWEISVTPDTAPTVQLSGPADVKPGGELRQAFLANDDHGVVSGFAEITLDMDTLSRRYGLEADPDPEVLKPLISDLPMPITGSRAAFQETFVERFEGHVWGGLPVILTLTVTDAVAQTGLSDPMKMVLPERRFFDPLAKAIVEQRRDILWALTNGAGAEQVLRAISHRPEGFMRNETAYLKLRVAMRRLGTEVDAGLTVEARDEIAELLWQAALAFEEGDVSSAAERLRRAQERLSEATRNGASDEEIAELMQELREAMRDYMAELAEESQRNAENGERQQIPEDAQRVTEQDLQDMMDRIQELMEQGRMAEAQELLDQLREMMENMQVAEGGEGGENPGEQAMEGLSDTLRDQQGLSDEAFRDLQEQFNPNAQAGESDGNTGRNGGAGRGESHEGADGEGSGSGNQEGSAGDAQSLAERQNALRDRLAEQQRAMPGRGTPEGDAAQDALDRAGRAMDEAAEALGDDRLGDALDRQSDAMEALRDGMRSLQNQMAEQNQQQGQGQEGNPSAQFDERSQDPLGREAGNSGRAGSNDSFEDGEDVYRRARELLDEIRRRSGDQERPEIELEYLKRLLDRF